MEMLQQDEPRDFVISTGRQESIRTFVELTAKSLDGMRAPPLAQLFGKVRERTKLVEGPILKKLW